MKDFSGLVKLLTDNGLTDVSHLGVASQSSLSQWSRPDDAQRATQDNSWDYAFHTGEDSRAWWTLTFPRRHFVSHIILENRRSADFQNHCADLSVHCSGPAGEELVHSRSVVFGALPGQMPLIITVNPKVPVTAIRIEKNTPGALHLSRVRVLCDAVVEGRFGGTMPNFIAQNTDGFGERLKAMMNAMLMARTFDGHFYFNWEPLQGTPDFLKSQSVDIRENTFSPEFIEKHHLDKEKLTSINIGEFQALAQDETFESKIRNYDGVVIRQNLANFQRTALSARKVNVQVEYPGIFESIVFSEPLARVKDLADRVDLATNTVAIHLRAGDVVYGAARTVGRFAPKSIPFPLVIDFIGQGKASGRDFLVFGQDEEFLTHLKQAFEVKLARDYLHDFTATEAALFEICLMSRCREIYAGTSGFASVASRRGQSPISSLYSCFEPEQAREIIHRHIISGNDLLFISDLQKSFACWAALYIYGDSLANTQTERDLLDAARRYDPENDLYRLADACSLYARGAGPEAEAILKNCFETRFSQPFRDNDLSILDTVRYTMKGVTTMPETWVRTLDAAARSGQPVAAFCMALIRDEEGKTALCDDYIGLFRAAGRTDHEAFHGFLDREMSR